MNKTIVGLILAIGFLSPAHAGRFNTYPGEAGDKWAGVEAPPYVDSGHRNASAVKCNCPPDCHCREAQGGHCPDKGDCLSDCSCDSRPTYAGGAFVHPDMIKAIQDEEIRRIKEKGIPVSTESQDFIMVEGIKQYTGFRPTTEFYEGADYLNIEVPDDFEMKSVDYSESSFTQIHGQVQGSCWAEATGTTCNLAWNTPGSRGFTKLDPWAIFAVQDVIDCSKMGSARSGGQISVSYALNGLALESDYNYTGRDGRCQKDAARVLPLERTPFLRGAEGGMPTERELNYWLNQFGPAAACGSAGALKNGGIHREMPSRGGTNHCYGYAGMRWDEDCGCWLHGVPNSWGDGVKSTVNPGGRSWGDSPKGWGWYRLAKEVGGKISGSILAEIQGAFTGHNPFVPPKPVVLHLVSGDVTLEVVIPVGVKYNASVAQDMLQAAID